MKLKKITQRDILYLSISMFAIVTLWIILNLYHSYVTSTISEDLQLKITPIDSSFDTATIDRLKSRNKVEPLFTPGTKQASPSATISATPENVEIEITPSEAPNETITPTVEPSLTQVPTITP